VNERTDGTVRSVDAVTGVAIGPYRKFRIRGEVMIKCKLTRRATAPVEDRREISIVRSYEVVVAGGGRAGLLSHGAVLRSCSGTEDF